MSRGCCVALPRCAMGVIVVFPDHTYFIKCASFAFNFSCYSFQTCFLSICRISFFKRYISFIMYIHNRTANMFFKVSPILVHAYSYVTITWYCIYVCSCQRAKLLMHRQIYHITKSKATENPSSTFCAHVNYSSQQKSTFAKEFHPPRTAK